MNEPRCLRLIHDAIRTFALDLRGLCVLTEAATGYYQLTAPIAALAGAERVLAVARDSRFGTAREVRQQTEGLCARLGVSDRVEVLMSRDHSAVCEADLITNLGFVRPIDGALLSRVKPQAVVSLMYETWELRPRDVDLDECRRRGIAILGTNENHADLMTFRYVGYSVLKLLFELDIELIRSRVVVVGSGEFSRATREALREAGALVTEVEIDRGMTLADPAIRRELARADAIACVELLRPEPLIGVDGQITAAELKALNPSIVVAHISGNVSADELTENAIAFQPQRLGRPGYMSVATDYLGPRPLIELNTAGLRVGDLLARARHRGLSAVEAEHEVLRKHLIAQGFPEPRVEAA